VKQIWTDKTTARPTGNNQRSAERRAVAVPARLTWKDQRGTTRFASVVARNVSDFGAYVECVPPVSIPLYRLVQFQVEHHAHDIESLPPAIRDGRILSAVYRVSAPTPAGARQGLALRLMIDPKRVVAEVPRNRATA
jgi:hypothetical protein